MASKNVGMNIDTGEKTWLTPRYFFDHLGHFDTDPCVPPNMPWETADRMYTKDMDGLVQPWHGRVWLNPPYGREATPFLRRMVAHRDEGGGIALVFARTDTALWHDIIVPNASSILFLRGRVKFLKPDGSAGETAPAPSALIGFGDSEAELLAAKSADGSLPGFYVRLRGIIN